MTGLIDSRGNPLVDPNKKIRADFQYYRQIYDMRGGQPAREQAVNALMMEMTNNKIDPQDRNKVNLIESKFQGCPYGVLTAICLVETEVEEKKTVN